MSHDIPLFIISENTPMFRFLETAKAFCKNHGFDSFAITYDMKAIDTHKKGTREKPDHDHIGTPLNIMDYKAIILVPPASAITDFNTEGIVFDRTALDVTIDAMSIIQENVDNLPNDITFGVMLPPELGMVCPTEDDNYIRVIAVKLLHNNIDNINHDQRNKMAHATIAAAIANLQLDYVDAEKSMKDIFTEETFSKELLDELIYELIKDRDYTPQDQPKIDILMKLVKHEDIEETSELIPKIED